MSEKIKKLLQGKGENYILPFFWQHGETEDVLRTYMKVIDESNIKAVCVESRPHPDFCGEQWWHDMDIILGEAKKRNMKVWILDDSHFPTGYANGAMEGQPDELRRQSICCRITSVKGGTTLQITDELLTHPDPFEKTMIETYVMKDDTKVFTDDRLLSLVAFPVGEKGEVQVEKAVNLMPFIKNTQLEWNVPEGEWKVYTLHLSRNHGYHRSYINMMSKDSCRVLIDAVYEPHYARYAEEFGTTIAGFFSDEPELGNGHLYGHNDKFGVMLDYPWSSELEQWLRDRQGENVFQMLPLLWEEQADKDLTAKVRYLYMDAVTELVKNNFSYQLGEWCRAHGVKYIGHVIEDDNHHSRTQSSLGHYFRGLEGQDMAGIDDIGGQVFPQGEEVHYDDGIFQHRDGSFYHYLLGKLASSAAAVEPWKHGDSMCEIFGNYGWEEGVQLEKYLADHFMVRGVNHYVPHAFSAKEFPDPDCPPHFYAHGHNPQYRHFGFLMKYMNRICELISGGYHRVTAAVLYHGEGDWAGDCVTDDQIGHVLYDHQIDYDIIPSDVFARPELFQTRVEDKCLKVHTQTYRAVIVPGTEYLVREAAEALLRMLRDEVPVYFAGYRPTGICNTLASAENMTAADEADLILAMEQIPVVETNLLAEELLRKELAEISILPEDDRIRAYHYIQDDSEVFYFVNEGTQTYHGSVTLPESVVRNYEVIYEYDAWENRVLSVQIDGNSVRLDIEPRKSRILIADKTPLADPLPESKCESTDTKLVSWNAEWVRSLCRSVEYPDFGDGKAVALPDALAEEAPLFSGFVRYENTFTGQAGTVMILEITDAAEGVEVFLNGQSLGIQIVPCYRYDLTGIVRDGENQIRIEVATTLEREMSQIPDRYGREKTPTSRSGITGEVRLLTD